MSRDLEALYYSTVAELHLDTPGDMTYSLAFEAPGLPAVTGTLAIDRANVLETGAARYTITAVLQTAADNSHATTLVFRPQVSPTQATDVERTGGNPSCTTTTYTTRVTWDPAVLTKGAAA